MDRENIALTVGGVLATMALAYWFYLKQQSDAAAASTAQADAIAAQDSAPAADPYNTNLTEEWLASSLTAASGAALTGLSSNSAASNSTSAAVSDLGAPFDAPDTALMINELVAHYSGVPSSTLDVSALDVGGFGPASAFNVGSAGSLTPGTPSAIGSIIVPAIAGADPISLGNVPTTAAEAIAQAHLALSPGGTSSPIYAPIDTPPQTGGANYYVPLNFSSFLASLQSSATTSSHPVTAHPIVMIGS